MSPGPRLAPEVPGGIRVRPHQPGNHWSVSQLPDRPALPADPGVCGACQYAAVKPTNRGTAYLRCTRAEWDERLVRYPRLPKSSCPGFAAAEASTGRTSS